MFTFSFRICLPSTGITFFISKLNMSFDKHLIIILQIIFIFKFVYFFMELVPTVHFTFNDKTGTFLIYPRNKFGPFHKMISHICNNVYELKRFCCILLIGILFSVNYYNFDGTVYKTIETKNGAVRGILNKTIFNDRPFFSYRGIPYAQPPTGELRFKVCYLSKF